ncbi:polyprotein [fipivirus C1]|uniref:Genome polyprotein n=1 Tax=fipivirus C1 TaxID=2116198 RepID=A0A2P1GN81_9PICO|nr:polyprotein [fipivirus C1]AVM87451.1 polyprotein [fipivirus C1]
MCMFNLNSSIGSILRQQGVHIVTHKNSFPNFKTINADMENFMKTSGALLGGVTDLVHQVGLADPKSEEIEMQNDRVGVLGAGAFLSVSQQSVSAMEMGSHQDQRTRAAVDLPGSQYTQAERFFPVGFAEWKTSQEKFVSVWEGKFPSIFMNKKYSIFGVLNYHTFARFGLEVQVQINPTNFQQGSLIVVAYPGPTKDRVSLSCLMQLPYCMLNANINNTGAFKAHFVHTRNMVQLHDRPGGETAPDVWTVVVYVWSPMRVTTGTSTICGVRVMARLVDLEVNGLRPAAQMMRVTVNPSQGAANLSNKKGTEPDLDMSLGPEAFPVDASMAGGLVMKDYKTQLHTPCWFKDFEMKTTQAQGEMLTMWCHGPTQPLGEYHDNQHMTNMTALSWYYHYWRGDIIYTLQVFCTRFHSGRIMISFLPLWGSTAPTYDEAISSATMFFDISGLQTTVRFRVPYESDRVYYPVKVKKGCEAGVVTVWVQNQLAAPTAVSSTVTISVLQHAADNFRFFVPTWEPKAQAGGEEAAGAVQDTFQQAPSRPGVTNVRVIPQEGAMTAAVEDPVSRSLVTAGFPEVSSGRETHTVDHMLVEEVMGRGHAVADFAVKNAGAFKFSVKLNLALVEGPLRGLLRWSYLVRGPMRLVVTFVEEQTTQVDTMSNTEVRIAFLPGDEDPGGESFSDWTMTSTGMIRTCFQTSSCVRLKLPWYTDLSAITAWKCGKTCTKDSTFGTLVFEGWAGAAFRCRMDLAFSNETVQLFPMPAQVLNGYDTDAEWKEMCVSAGCSALRARRSAYAVDEDQDTDESGDDRVQVLVKMDGDNYYDDEGVVYARGQAGCDDDDDDVGISMVRECWLVKRSAQLYDHYGVRVDDFVVHLEPRDMTWRWVLSTKADVIIERVNSKWEDVEESPYPGVSASVALRRVGDVMDYSVVGHNCEVFARQCTFMSGKQDQVGRLEAASKYILAGLLGATVLAGAVSIAVAHADKDAVVAEIEEDGKVRRKKFNPVGAFVKNLAVKTAREMKPEVAGVTERIASVAEDTAGEVQAASRGVRELAGSIRSAMETVVSKVKKGTEKRETVLNVTGVVLDMLSLCCELVAAVATKEESTRALVVTSIVARFGSAIVGGITKVCDALVSNVTEGQGKRKSATLTSGVCDVAEKLVEQRLKVKGTGSLVDYMRGFVLCASTLMTAEKLVKFLAKMVDAIQRWVCPKSPEAHLHKVLSKAHKRVPELIKDVDAVLVRPTGTRTLREKVLADLKVYYKRLSLWHSWCVAAKSPEFVKLTGVLRGYLDKVVRAIVECSVDDTEPFRAEPLVIWLHGKKGSGKSVASLMLAAHICAREGWDFDSEMYSKAPGADYYDAYEGQRIMVVDDMGQNTDGKDFADFCQIVSAAPVRLNMARLKDKGKAFVTPIIIASSNVEDPQPIGVSDVDAVRRRLKLKVSVSPASMYAQDGMLDYDKARMHNTLRDMSCVNMTWTNAPKGRPAITLAELVEKTVSMLKRRREGFEAMKREVAEIMKGEGDPSGTGSDEEEDVDEMMWNVDPPSVGVCDFEENMMATYKHLRSYDMSDEFVYVGGFGPGKMDKTDWEKFKVGVDKHAWKVFAVFGTVSVAMGVVVGIYYAVKASTKNSSDSHRAYESAPVARVKRIPIKRESPSAEGQAHVEVARLARGNAVRIGVFDKGRVMWTASGLFIRERDLLVVKHTIGRTERLYVARPGCDTLEYNMSDLTPVPIGDDLLLITLPPHSLPAARDIVKHFVTEADLERVAHTDAVIYMRNSNVFPVSDLKQVRDRSYVDTDTDEDIRNKDMLIGDGRAMPGACGSAWVSLSTRMDTGIVGVHVAGSDHHVYCQVVTREMLLDVHKAIGHSRVVRIVEFDGTVPRATRSTLRETPLRKWFDSGKEPAVLGPWDERTEVDPVGAAMRKFRAPVTCEPPAFVSVVEHMKAKVSAHTEASVDGSGEAETLTLEQVVEGIEGMEGLDMNTSAGFPWCVMNRKKKDMIKMEGGKVVSVDPALRESVMEVYDWLTEPTNDNKPELLYVSHLKDELLDSKKVVNGRSRVICAAPVQLVLAWKMVLGRAIAAIHKEDVTKVGAPTGCAVGMDPEEAWSDIVQQRPGWKVIALDYSNFDGSLQVWVMRAAVEVLAAAAKRPFYEVDRLTSVVTEVTQIIDKYLVTTVGSLPSGCPSTSILGSLCNVLMLKYYLHVVTGVSYRHMRDVFHIVTYGDDALVFVSPEIEGVLWLDMLAPHMKNVFGVEVTGSEKSRAPSLEEVSKVTFLKRGFRECSAVPGRWHPTMALSTCFQLAGWCRRRGNLVENLKMMAEFVFHHGECVYTDIRTRLFEAMEMEMMVGRREVVEAWAPYAEMHDLWARGI